MKYICLGFFDERKWEAISESQQNAFFTSASPYDEGLRKNGHWVGGEALQSTRNAITLRWKSGKVSITDGPYAETKEQFGRIWGVRSQGPGPRRPVDVKAPGCEDGNSRDSLRRGLDRNDP
jgi:hypothetical protein